MNVIDSGALEQLFPSGGEMCCPFAERVLPGAAVRVDAHLLAAFGILKLNKADLWPGLLKGVKRSNRYQVMVQISNMQGLLDLFEIFSCIHRQRQVRN